MNRTEILNQRILERNNLANNLNIRFSPRSLPTKYSLPENINTINNFKPFNIIGNNTDFENKINDESILKNRINPLQKCEQSQYIPNIDGQLYNYNIENIKNKQDNTVTQMFPRLFETPVFSNIDNDNDTNGKLNNNFDNEFFNNDTRQQLKNN